jgi:hypothetical protein
LAIVLAHIGVIFGECHNEATIVGAGDGTTMITRKIYIDWK